MGEIEWKIIKNWRGYFNLILESGDHVKLILCGYPVKFKQCGQQVKIMMCWYLVKNYYLGSTVKLTSVITK